MEVPVAESRRLESSTDVPVKLNAMEQRKLSQQHSFGLGSASTRAPSDMHSNLGPKYTSERMPTEDCLPDYEFAADDLLMDYGVETKKEVGFFNCTSPSPSEEDSPRGGFHCGDENENKLVIDWDQDTPADTADHMFHHIMGDSDKVIGKIAFDRVNNLRASFEGSASMTFSGDAITPPTSANKGNGFKHTHRRLFQRTATSTADNDFYESTPPSQDGLHVSETSDGMAGAAGSALLRWRRCGRTSPC